MRTAQHVFLCPISSAHCAFESLFRVVPKTACAREAQRCPAAWRPPLHREEYLLVMVAEPRPRPRLQAILEKLLLLRRSRPRDRCRRFHRLLLLLPPLMPRRRGVLTYLAWQEPPRSSFLPAMASGAPDLGPPRSPRRRIAPAWGPCRAWPAPRRSRLSRRAARFWHSGTLGRLPLLRRRPPEKLQRRRRSFAPTSDRDRPLRPLMCRCRLAALRSLQLAILSPRKRRRQGMSGRARALLRPLPDNEPPLERLLGQVFRPQAPLKFRTCAPRRVLRLALRRIRARRLTIHRSPRAS